MILKWHLGATKEKGILTMLDMVYWNLKGEIAELEVI